MYSPKPLNRGSKDGLLGPVTIAAGRDIFQAPTLLERAVDGSTGKGERLAPRYHSQSSKYAVKSFARCGEFRERIQRDLGCPAPWRKIFSFSFDPNHRLILCRLIPHEGTLAIVTNVGMRCGGREGVIDEQR
jgi:hypothetical protein